MKSDPMKTCIWFRSQVKMPIIGLRSDAMKRAQVIQVVAVVGYRLYDDIIEGLQSKLGDPAHRKDFAVVQAPAGQAVHFEGAAIMAGSREEMVTVTNAATGKEDVATDPGYIHPWSLRIDWFVTYKNGSKVKHIRPRIGSIVLCPEEHRIDRAESAHEKAPQPGLRGSLS